MLRSTRWKFKKNIATSATKRVWIFWYFVIVKIQTDIYLLCTEFFMFRGYIDPTPDAFFLPVEIPKTEDPVRAAQSTTSDIDIPTTSNWDTIPSGMLNLHYVARFLRSNNLILSTLSYYRVLWEKCRETSRRLSSQELYVIRWFEETK